MDRQPRVWPIVAAVAVALWTIALTGFSQLAGYALDLGTAALDGGLAPDWLAVGITLVVATLVILPAALLGWLSRPARVRAAGQLWTWAAVAFAVLGTARLAPAEQHELYLGVLAATATVLAVLFRRPGPGAAGSARLAAVTGGLAMLLPWAWIGALGGLLETTLAAAAAAAIGWLAAGLLARAQFSDGWARRLVLGGLVGTTALVPLAAGTGEAGVSLAELVVLPLLGFAAAALRRGVGLLIGFAAAGPLAFVDPEETLAILGTSDVGYWSLIAAACALGISVLVDGWYVLTHGRHRGVAPPVAAGAAAVLALAVGAVHVTLGQPGLHGERLFVVLDEQADLAGIEAIPERDRRLRETYRRLVDTADRTQGPLRRELRRLRVGFSPYYLVNGLEVNGGPAVRAWLAGRAEVDRVLSNPVLRPLPAPPQPMRGRAGAPDAPLWNVQRSGADRVWSQLGVRGAGVVIGTSDSGVDGSHPALAKGFRGGDDSWHDPWNGTREPTDNNGHGTHTLGSAAGGSGIGVAPDAQWIGCVNLDRNLGNPARYLDCLQFMLAPFPPGADPLRSGRPERAPHILNNSWGCPPLEGCDGRVLQPAVAALVAAGIFFVAAAGNTGPACGSIDAEPATVTDAFTVGAVDRSATLADFSSRGPVPGAAEPDAVAPGVDVLSALPGGGYGELSGTSMAAPHVAGVVALMWSANPRLIGDVRRTAELLRSTAQPATPTYRSRTEECGGAANVIGAGLVDGYAAVQAAGAPAP